MRKDGLVYEKLRKQGDDLEFHKMAKAVELLSLSYYYTNNEDYGKHAVRFLNTWFLDQKTRMNPNVNYGQIIVGRRDKGRRAGINEMRFLTNIVECIPLLNTSKYMDKRKKAGLKEWFKNYLTWLKDSSHGKEEIVRPNNHGTWYDLQYVSIAYYLGEMDKVKNQIEVFTKKRIKSQILPTGEMPLETARAASLHYSFYNIRAFFGVAKYAEKVGIDLWKYQEGQVGLKLALDYLLPYATNPSKWPHKDLGRSVKKFMPNILSQAYSVYKDKKYHKAYLKILKDPPSGYSSYTEKLIVL